MITLPSGKQVPAGAYYAELNRLEQEFNKLGYSFRDQPNRPPTQRKRTVLLQQNRMDSALFQQQDNLIKLDHRTPLGQSVAVPLERFSQLDAEFQSKVRQLSTGAISQPLSMSKQAIIGTRSVGGEASAEETQAFRKYQEQAMKDQLLAERIQADRELGIDNPESEDPTAAKEIDEQVQNVKSEKVTTRGTDSISEQDRETFAQWGNALQLLSEATSPEGGVTTRGGVNKALLSSVRADLLPTQIHKSKGVDWTGGNTWFGATVQGKATLDGYPTMVTTHGDLAIGGRVIGSSVSLLNTEGTVTAPMTGPMTAVAKLTVVGTTIVNINKSQTLAWSESNAPSRPFNKVTPSITIWLGPVPLNVKAGIRGSLGMNYTVGFVPVRAYVTLGPTVNVSAYAQADIGADLILVEAHAGVRGTLVLVNEQFVAKADAGLAPVNGALAYQTTFAIYNDLHMLDGSLDAFVTIEYPCVPDFWNSCEDEWTHQLFAWTGIHAAGYLVNEVATINVYGRPAATLAIQ
jgi:hypothetical protein